jgi:hypothetical protein
MRSSSRSTRPSIVIGPIYFRTLIAGVPVDDAFVDSVVGAVVGRRTQ